MNMPIRQSRPMPGGAPNTKTSDSAEPVLTWEDRAQQALDYAKAAVPYVPVVGPAYDTIEDLRAGNYAGAAFNGLMLAADLSPVGPYLKAAKLLKAIDKMKRASLLARAGTQTKRVRKIEDAARAAKNIGGKYEVHHTIPMNGLGPIGKAGRNEVGLWRNHPFNLKILPKEIHDAVHTSFGNRYTDPFLKAWHGTNALQKSAAAATAATVTDEWENVARPVGDPSRPGARR